MSLWMQIAEYIQKQIDSHAWRPGFILPNETQLAEQFHASRPTVRAALTKLETQGLVKRIKGKGTIVQPTYKLEDTSIFLESFTKEVKQKGEHVLTRVFFLGTCPADDYVANKLRIKPGTEIIRVTRLRYVENRFDQGPLVYSHGYLPSRYSFLLDGDFENNSLYQILDQHGIYRTVMYKDLLPTILKDDVADISGVFRGSLGILLETVSENERQEVIEFSQSFWPIAKNDFKMTVRL